MQDLVAVAEHLVHEFAPNPPFTAVRTLEHIDGENSLEQRVIGAVVAARACAIPRTSSAQRGSPSCGWEDREGA